MEKQVFKCIAPSKNHVDGIVGRNQYWLMSCNIFLKNWLYYLSKTDRHDLCKNKRRKTEEF